MLPSRRAAPLHPPASHRRPAGSSRRTSPVPRRPPGRRALRWTWPGPASPDPDATVRLRCRPRRRFARGASPRGRRRRNIRRAAREASPPRNGRGGAAFRQFGAGPGSAVPGRSPGFRLRFGRWRRGSPWPPRPGPASALRRAPCSRRSAPTSPPQRPTAPGLGWFPYLLSA